LSAYGDAGVGIVLVFVKNFDLGAGSLLLGDSTQSMATNTESLSNLAATIQSESPLNPVASVGEKLTRGMRLLTDFIVARITAIRGYFDEIFVRRVHTEELCVRKSDGNEVCMNGDELESAIPDAAVVPTAHSHTENNSPESSSSTSSAETSAAIPTESEGPSTPSGVSAETVIPEAPVENVDAPEAVEDAAGGSSSTGSNGSESESASSAIIL
jgi:hypothetical protein